MILFAPKERWSNCWQYCTTAYFLFIFTILQVTGACLSGITNSEPVSYTTGFPFTLAEMDWPDSWNESWQVTAFYFTQWVFAIVFWLLIYCLCYYEGLTSPNQQRGMKPASKTRSNTKPPQPKSKVWAFATFDLLEATKDYIRLRASSVRSRIKR